MRVFKKLVLPAGKRRMMASRHSIKSVVRPARGNEAHRRFSRFTLHAVFFFMAWMAFSTHNTKAEEMMQKPKITGYSVREMAEPRNLGYAVGAAQVWFENTPTEIDAASCKILDTLYAKDKNHVYIEGKKIDGANPKDFSVLTEGYARDKNGLYFFGKRLPDLNIEKFVILGEGYAKDDTKVYRSGRVFKPADPATFVVFNNKFAKDKNHVYFWGEIVRGAEGESFQILSDDTGKDKNHVYRNDEEMDADVKTFRVLDSYYSVDKNRVYYWGHPIQGADVKTFKPLCNYGYAADKKQVYHNGKIIKGASPKTFVVPELPRIDL